jgi:hypothetical protein
VQLSDSWFVIGLLAVAGFLFYKAIRPPAEPKILWKTSGAGSPLSRRTYTVFGLIALSWVFVDRTSNVWFFTCFAVFVATAIADIRYSPRVRDPYA